MLNLQNESLPLAMLSALAVMLALSAAMPHFTLLRSTALSRRRMRLKVTERCNNQYLSIVHVMRTLLGKADCYKRHVPVKACCSTHLH